MTRATNQRRATIGGVFGVFTMFLVVAFAQDSTPKAPAPMGPIPKNAPIKVPVVAPEDFQAVMTRMQAAKPAIQQTHADLPEHFLPEFSPPIFLTTRPGLGDVSQGKLVTMDNFQELLGGVLNPKQLEGLQVILDRRAV